MKEHVIIGQAIAQRGALIEHQGRRQLQPARSLCSVKWSKGGSSGVVYLGWTGAKPQVAKVPFDIDDSGRLSFRFDRQKRAA